MSLYSRFFESMVVPGYDLFRGTNRSGCNRVLERTQWLSPRQIKSIQVRNLRSMLRHAFETVPYYRKVFDDKGLRPSDIKSENDMLGLPLLTKAEVNNNFNDLVSGLYRQGELVPYQSGGSGEPLSFYITRDQMSWELAAEQRAYRWAGYTLGDVCFLLWGSNIELSKKADPLNVLTKSLERVEIGDAWLLSDDVLGGFVQRLIRRKPRVIRGYANAIYMLAKYCLDNCVKAVNPVAVITSAEKLTLPRRRVIEEAFSCKVSDYYGSREIGAMAAECEEHSGYHISAENVFVEFVKDGEHVSPGEEGAIIVTNLRNYGMPFIRYQIGDVGVPSDETCVCGRGLPLMASLEGRFSDFLSVYDEAQGKVVPYMVGAPGFVGAALMHVPVISYRVIQESLERMRIQIVKGPGFTDRHSDEVSTAINNFLGRKIMVEFEYLDSIPPLPSGKRSSFISKINAFTGA